MNIARIIHFSPALMSEIQELGEELYIAHRLPGNFCVGHFSNSWNELLRMGIASVWLATDDEGLLSGGLGMILHPDLASGITTAAEGFWFIKMSARSSMCGARLIETMLAWANDLGVKQVVVSHMNSVKTASSYLINNGFRAIETVYMKEL